MIHKNLGKVFGVAFLVVILGLGVVFVFLKPAINPIPTAVSTTQSTTTPETAPTDITFCHQKIGEMKNERISIPFDGYTYSFAADTASATLLSANELTLWGGCNADGSLPSDWNDRVTYKHLIMHFPRNADLIRVTYACDAPLAGKLYADCKTNGTNYVSEYEFGGGYLSKINGKENDYGQTYRWEKVMVKKIGGKNMIFEGILSGPSGNSWAFGTKLCGSNPVQLCRTPQEEQDLYVSPRSLFAVYESLHQFHMVADRHLYANTISYDTTAPWYQALLPQLDTMLHGIESGIYPFYLSRQPNNARYERAWNQIINSFTVEKIHNV